MKFNIDLFFLLYLLFFLAIYIPFSLLDLTKRKISNGHWKWCFFLGGCIFITKLVIIPQHTTSWLLIQILYLFILFLLLIYLFSIKIIGGSDGKFVFFIFLTAPAKYFNIYYISLFFLFFSILIVFNAFVKILLNLSSKKRELLCYFNTEKLTLLNKYYIRSFYTLLDLKMRSYSHNYTLRSNYMIFNYYKEKLQFIVQIKLPLIIHIGFSYLVVIFLF